MKRLAVISSFFLLVACSTSPKPPVADGFVRSPINSKATTEMLALRAELAQAQEQLRGHGGTAVTKSQIVSVQFPFKGTQFHPTPDQFTALLSLLRNADRIEVRGRTDGQVVSLGDEQLASRRVVNAKRFLVKQGAPSAIIALNYPLAGDYVSDDTTTAGRSQNRRVDIEIFNK